MASLSWIQERLPTPLRSLPTHMDFIGQKKAERIYQIIITCCGIIGLLLGYAMQRFSYSVYTVFAGFILSCLIILPPWPYFRRNKVAWQKPVPEAPVATKNEPNASSKKKKKN